MAPRRWQTHGIGNGAEVIALNPQLMNRIGNRHHKATTIRHATARPAEAALEIVTAQSLEQHHTHTIPERRGQREQIRRGRNIGRLLGLRVTFIRDLHVVVGCSGAREGSVSD